VSDDLLDGAGRYAGPVVDAHHHVWDLERNLYPWLTPDVLVPHRYGDYTAMKKTYSAADYLADIAGQGVVSSVYMEAEWDPTNPLGETRYIESVHADTGVPGAMVAQAWLDADDVEEILAAQASSPLVRSVRHKPGGPSSPTASGTSLMSDERWRAGYARLSAHGLHFDLQTPWWNLAEARRLADDFPETTLVVNHSGVLLDREPETVAAWRAALSHIAEAPNTVIKASGLCVEGVPWSTELNREVLRDIVRIFGADRVMFGSNFPVDGMFVSYRGLLDTYRDVYAELPADEQRAIFAGTAERVYRPAPIAG